MIYIICQDWPSTSGNHAGMLHLYKRISEDIKECRLYIVDYKGFCKYDITKKLYIYLMVFFFCFKLKKGDKVILTEYLMRSSYQDIIAKWIHVLHPNIKIDAMVHLVPSLLEKSLSRNKIIKNSTYVTRLITLGTSLTKYLNSLNIKNVHTSFHYVDLDYYRPHAGYRDESISAIVMGALDRDFKLLAEVIEKVPEIHFYICKGKKKIDSYFINLPNVTLLGFLPENKLKEYMNKANISLNIINDTIGSNVICTSLAMGLAMVVSDVGSIHDYCTKENSFFCKTKDDFIKALNKLSHDKELMQKMSNHSIKTAPLLSIDRFRKDIEI